MSLITVDASIVVKWFVPERDSDAARRLLDDHYEFIAPDILFAEVANTIWKKVRRGELTPTDGRQLVADVGRTAIETVSDRSLAGDAYALATASGQTVYDAMYLALAIRARSVVVTADARLVEGLAPMPDLAGFVRLVDGSGA